MSRRSNEEFAEWMRKRTLDFAIAVINYCGNLPFSQATKVISFQLIKSATSTAANYRAACRARSQAEFHSKLSIAVEEIDESKFWLEILQRSEIQCSKDDLIKLIEEAFQILKILSTSRKTVRSRNKPSSTEEPPIRYSLTH